MLLSGIEDILTMNSTEEAEKLLSSIAQASNLEVQLEDIDSFLSDCIASWEDGCHRRGRAILHILDLLKQHPNYRKVYEEYQQELMALIGKPDRALVELFKENAPNDDFKLTCMRYLDEELIKSYLLASEAGMHPLALAIQYHPDKILWFYEVLRKVSPDTRLLVLLAMDAQTWRLLLTDIINNQPDLYLSPVLKILGWMPLREQEIIYNNLPPNLFIVRHIDLTLIENQDAVIETNVRYYLHQFQLVAEKIRRQSHQTTADKKIVNLYDSMANDLGDDFVDNRNWSNIKIRWTGMINDQTAFLTHDKVLVRILLNLLLCFFTAGFALPFVCAKVLEDHQKGRMQFGYFKSINIEGYEKAQEVINETPSQQMVC